MKNQRTIAVTGITGHTGRYFLKELINHNYSGKIKCLVRDTSNTEALDDSGLNIEKISGDINNEKVLNKLLENVDILVHIVNIRYSPLLVEIAKKQGVKRIVLVHTTGVYSKHKLASEEYKKIEKNLEPYINDKNLSITILQPTMIFGDLCDHNISKFISIADKLPFVLEVNHGKAKIQPVNARDLGKAYYLCAMEKSLPETYYVVSGKDILSLHELMKKIRVLLGKKPLFVSVPLFIAEPVAIILKMISFKKIDLVEKVQRLAEDKVFSHEYASRDFGYKPESFEKGLKREVIQFTRKNIEKLDK